MKLTHEVCTVEGCTREHKARGYCASHYAQWLRAGRILTPVIASRVAEKPPCCVVEGCDKPVKGKGLCGMHWARNSRHGHVKKPERIQPRVACNVSGCTDWTYAKGMCHAHYIRVRRLRKNFGLSWGAALVKAASMPEVCDLCGKEPSTVHLISMKLQALCLDHNHTTGALRGWLCHSCNRGIGMLQDDPGLMEKAARYVRKWQGS